MTPIDMELPYWIPLGICTCQSVRSHETTPCNWSCKGPS
jgi:hypothetical protein